jgi:hypothetical protein
MVQKNFTTADYRVVFYDKAGFSTCLKGASSSALANAKWDTTAGWLLGYRESPSYVLSDYVDTIVEDITLADANNFYLKSATNICCLTGDTGVSVNLFNYFLIVLDDYTQNHLNDGLVTTAKPETVIEPPLGLKVVCDPITKKTVVSSASDIPMTAKQIYAAQQKLISSQIVNKTYSQGPFVKDVFGIIPMKLTGIQNAQVYVEFGGTLQNQNRIYFGPVNITRMSIQLLSDRGNLVDLNNTNWSFSLIAEQLYKK